jgi:hypothetical protein
MMTGAVIGDGDQAVLERCQRSANKAGEPDVHDQAGEAERQVDAQ